MAGCKTPETTSIDRILTSYSPHNLGTGKSVRTSFLKSKGPQNPSFFETSCLLCLSLGPLAAHHPMLLTLFAPESQETHQDLLGIELWKGWKSRVWEDILSPNKKFETKNEKKSEKQKPISLVLPSNWNMISVKVISEVIHISQCFF